MIISLCFLLSKISSFPFHIEELFPVTSGATSESLFQTPRVEKTIEEIQLSGVSFLPKKNDMVEAFGWEKELVDRIY